MTEKFKTDKIKADVFFFPGTTTPIGGCILQPPSGL